MWICCQIGAREHYAVPRALHQGGRLATLYTDFWAGRALRRASEIGDGRWKIGGLRSLAARFHPELARDRWPVAGGQKSVVQSWNVRALLWEASLRQRSDVSGQLSAIRGQLSAVRGRYPGYIEVGRRFAVRVREALKRRSDLGPDSLFFAYDTGALETMEWCQEKGIRCILNQMDPNRVEVELVRAEEKHWPGWAPYSTQVPEAYFRRREQEWALADRVVVNSEFCRQALVKQGVSSEKLVVVPLCYEVEEVQSPRSKVQCPMTPDTPPSTLNTQLSPTPLCVLFLGQVILRKGIQYLIEAAKLLRNEPVHFDVVGPIGISEEPMKSAPANMAFHGRVNRDEAGGWYEQADVFVLPTLSDGFAITQLEAMAYGLPVVTTPCCGDVVSDGVDGFIVPARDADALAKMFLRYLAEPDLLKSQQQAALAKARKFTLERLAGNLESLEVLMEDKR
jgi:glycosyltransferase involved in cell wall biosynthesis